MVAYSKCQVSSSMNNITTLGQRQSHKGSEAQEEPCRKNRTYVNGKSVCFGDGSELVKENESGKSGKVGRALIYKAPQC